VGDAGSQLPFEEVETQVQAGANAAGGDQVAVVDHPRGYGDRAGCAEQIVAEVLDDDVAPFQGRPSPAPANRCRSSATVTSGLWSACFISTGRSV
jgi:hypothetical protein